MKFLYYVYCFLLLPILLQAKSGNPANSINNASSVNNNAAPIEFVANGGQWSGNFLYRAEAGAGDVYLLNNGLYTLWVMLPIMIMQMLTITVSYILARP